MGCERVPGRESFAIAVANSILSRREGMPWTLVMDTTTQRLTRDLKCTPEVVKRQPNTLAPCLHGMSSRAGCVQGVRGPAGVGREHRGQPATHRRGYRGDVTHGVVVACSQIVRQLHAAPHCCQVIVSDANSVYIPVRLAADQCWSQRSDHLATGAGILAAPRPERVLRRRAHEPRRMVSGARGVAHAPYLTAPFSGRVVCCACNHTWPQTHPMGVLGAH